jgi:hypothetical protein
MYGVHLSGAAHTAAAVTVTDVFEWLGLMSLRRYSFSLRLRTQIKCSYVFTEKLLKRIATTAPEQGFRYTPDHACH